MDGCRMEKILDEVVRDCPGSQVILMGVLPRGIPDDAGAIRWPSKYARGLLAVNARYEAAATKYVLSSLPTCPIKHDCCSERSSSGWNLLLQL